MDEKVHVIPKYKKASTIFFVVMLLLCIGMLIFSSWSYHYTSEPEDLLQVSCSFVSYEIDQHLRSSSYDLLLISDAYNLPFKVPFFDGYKNKLYPEDFCTGSTYTLMVSPSMSHYTVYSCFDATGNCIMTKSEAYSNSQHTAHILVLIMLHFFAAFCGLMLLIIHRPYLFSDQIKKFFFGHRKTISF